LKCGDDFTFFSKFGDFFFQTFATIVKSKNWGGDKGEQTKQKNA
jgi:hypothetical protein